MRTETGSRSIAESVFKAFLERYELEDTEVSLYLVYQRLTLAVHRFDATQGTQDNWQGRTGEIAWPERPEQVGRPTEREGGARHNVYLNAVSITRARKLGKGNISAGIRIARSRV